MKVAVYAIARNEQEFVTRWYESAKEADYVILVDTGSTDDTFAIAEGLGADVCTVTIDPWRFDAAKNHALALVPDDADVAVSLDMDEVLLPGWRAKLEQTWEPDATILNHRYRNNSNPWQWHSKIHNRHHCTWVGAVHETLEWSIPEKQLWNAEIYLDEQQDVTKSRAGYLELLQLKIAEGDNDWKTFYFLANEYESRGDILESIYQREAALSRCDEPVSRAYISKHIANAYMGLGQISIAHDWYRASVGESPERESWYALAKHYHDTAQWDACYEAASSCIGVTVKRDGYTFDASAWGASAHDLAAIAAYNLGRYSLALEYGSIAALLAPEDERIQNNLKSYREMQGQ